MATPVFANNLSTALASTITSTATSITLVSGTAVPAVPTGQALVLYLTQPTAPETSWEVISCPGPITAGATTLTGITRGVEVTGGIPAASTPQAWAAGTKVENRLTAAQLAALEAGVGAITSVTASGSVAATTSAGGAVALVGSGFTGVVSDDNSATFYQVGTTLHQSSNLVIPPAGVISVTPAAGLVNTGTSTAPIIGYDPVGHASRYIKPSRIGTRLYIGAGLNTTNASSFNYVSGTAPNVAFSSMFDIETDFDEIALVFGNQSTANTLAVGPVTITVGPNASDTTYNTGFFAGTSVTFSGSTTATIPVASVPNGAGSFLPTLLVSDFVQISSLDRTDIVGARPLLYVRTNFTPVSGTTQISTVKYTGSDFSGSGVYGRPTLSVFTGTAAPVTTSSWPAGGAISGWYSPIAGILYKSRYGRVFSYIAIGDSITNGAGTSTGLSWPEKASQLFMVNGSGGSLTAKSAFPVEGSKLAVNGTNNATFDRFYDYLVAAGISPNAIVYSAYTPNSLGTNLSPWRQGVVRTMTKVDANGQYPITWTGLPTGPSFTTNPLANDTARLLFNSQLLQSDTHVVDMSTALTDPTNLQTTGAYQMLAAYTSGAASSPGLHPNNAGDTVMANTFATQALTPITANYYAGKTK